MKRKKRSGDPTDRLDDESGDPQRTSKGPIGRSRPGNLRIIGGDLRNRPVRYHGGPSTRPMKDNIRENLFNILGQAIKGTKAFDLFSGTGALAIESISRGGSSAIAVEQSKHASRFIRESVEKFGILGKMTVLTGDTFRLAPRLLRQTDDDTPWIVYLCPPYRMWDDEDDLAHLNAIIQLGLDHAPPGSVIVAETEKHFDPARLPPGNWDLREYGNTRLCFIEPAMICGMR